MGICICCCCNKQKTECIETTLIVFQSIEIVFLILSLFLIEWDIAGSLGLIINILILLFLIFNLLSVILFKVFQDNEKIYTKYKKLCTTFAYISMGLSIGCFILSIISESVISEKVFQYDHPCLYKISEEESNEETRLRNIAEFNETLIKQYCEEHVENSLKDKDIFWHNRRSAYKDILMPYICSTIIEALSFLSIFFYYNNMKRIKYCIKGRMSEETGVIIYGQFGEYIGKNGANENKVYNKNVKKNNYIKSDNNNKGKEKENNVLNINKNNNIISEDNSIILNYKNKQNTREYEIENEQMNDFEGLSNISKKNPSEEDNKQPETVSNDLEIFY